MTTDFEKQLNEITSLHANYDDDSHSTYFSDDEYEKFLSSLKSAFSELAKACIGEDEYPANDMQNVNYKRTQRNRSRDQLREEIRERFRAKGIMI